MKIYHKQMIKRFSTLSFLRLNFLISSRITTRQVFLQKLNSKKYREILGISQERQNIFKDKDLHRAYLNQIKKFHSDNVQSEEAKKEFQEITKCIISAYEELKKEDQNYKESTKSEKVIFSEQEEIAQRLFDKGYQEIKYSMYAPGNEEVRAKFLEELEKKKRTKEASQQQPQKESSSGNREGSSYQTSTVASEANGSLFKFLAIAVACGLLAIPIFSRNNADKSAPSQPRKQVKVREYTEKEYDTMEQNSSKILMKPFQAFFNTILKRRPHMLTYPIGKDPHILEQLTKYSIAPDIHLFEIPSKYLLSEEEIKNLKNANTTEHIQKYELTETKPNTLLTLSLQAERILHNVYIRVDDVLSEIKATGKFTPPKILFKYHGYILFQIRNKPFSTLQCYRNTRYISLFDLYFDYYSPIFFKRDHFREYLAGFQQESPLKNSRYFGNVYLNHRSVPKVYLQKGEKVAIMKDPKKALDPSGSLKRSQEMYLADWQNFYARFQKNWKKYCSHQKEGHFIY